MKLQSYQTWHKASMGEGDSRFYNNDHSILKKERMFFTAPNQCYDIIKCVYRFEMVSQVSNVAPEPLV